MSADADGIPPRLSARIRADRDRLVTHFEAWLDRSRAPSGALGRIARGEEALSSSAERHRTLAWLVPAVIVCSAGLILSAILLSLPITFGFSLDGQTVIDERLKLTWAHLLTPFHTHLNLIPILIWNRMAAVFGTASSTPYLALLLATHVGLAAATTVALARRIGSVLAVAFGLPLVLLGSAYFNLIAPWQILFTLTLLAGLVCVWTSIERERTIKRQLVVATFLILAVLTSNLAVFITVALVLWFVMDGRTNQLRELVPAMVVFGLWFITWGRTGLGADGSPTTLASVLAVVPYTALGLASGAGGMIGLGPVAGAFLLGALAMKFRPPKPMLAFLIAIVAMFAVGALFRYMSGVEQALVSRYITLVAYMTVFGILAAGYSPPVRPAVALVLSLLVVIGNLVTLALALPAFLAT